MQTGSIKATPISNTALRNSKTLGKRHPLPESLTTVHDYTYIVKITWKGCRLRKLT
jgi:hypothetical protein